MKGIVSRTFTTHKTILKNVLTHEVVEVRYHERKPDQSVVIRSYLRTITKPVPISCSTESVKQKYEMSIKDFMKHGTRVELEDF